MERKLLTDKRQKEDDVCVEESEERIRVNILIYKDAWEKAKPLLKEIGMNRSRFLEVTLKMFVESKDQTMDQVIKGMFTEMINDALRIGRLKPK